jgi:hypothetical protein
MILFVATYTSLRFAASQGSTSQETHETAFHADPHWTLGPIAHRVFTSLWSSFGAVLTHSQLSAVSFAGFSAAHGSEIAAAA